MKKICVRMPNWIGDLVMATPLLRDLRANFPSSEITVLAASPLDSLLGNCPYVDRVLGFSRKSRWWPKLTGGTSLIKWLRKERFDVAILTTNSFSSAYLFWLGGVKKRIGLYKRCRAGLINISVQRPVKKEHLALTYKRLLTPLGIERTSSPIALWTEAKKKPIGKTWIGINPGAAYGSAKCWLPERFKAVIEAISKEIPGSEIWVFGDAKTAPLCEEICRDMPVNVHNLAGKTSLQEFIAYIAALDVFLTNDSGPMHVAAALKTPLVALFGSTSAEITGPYQWGHVIHKHVACSPCYKRTCPIDFRCMRSIGVREVIDAMKKQLLTRPKQNLATPFFWEGATVPAYEEKMKTSRQSAAKRGVIILAGGKGRRLGYKGPKGCIKLGERSLYQILLEKCRGVRVLILTSPATHEETKKHLQEVGEAADLVSIRMLPALVGEEESPEGNGALFETVCGHEIWGEWKDIEVIDVTAIDNPLAEPLDPHMEPQKGEELVVKAVRKLEPNENLGTLVEKEGSLYVCEYFENELRSDCEMNNDEAVTWQLGYSGMFSVTKEFFEKMAKRSLPWHIVEKGDLKFLERLVIDAFPHAKNYRVLLDRRSESFAPIKTDKDLATVEKVLYTLPSEAGES